MHSCINATVLNTQHIFTLVSLLYWFCIAQNSQLRCMWFLSPVAWITILF